MNSIAESILGDPTGRSSSSTRQSLMSARGEAARTQAGMREASYGVRRALRGSQESEDKANETILTVMKKNIPLKSQVIAYKQTLQKTIDKIRNEEFVSRFNRRLSSIAIFTLMKFLFNLFLLFPLLD